MAPLDGVSVGSLISFSSGPARCMQIRRPQATAAPERDVAQGQRVHRQRRIFVLDSVVRAVTARRGETAQRTTARSSGAR